MSEIILIGNKVKDTVTGLVGTVVAKCIYLNGCVQLLVQPKVVEHRIVEGYWIDETQLKLINPPKPKKLVYNEDLGKGGGVRAHP